MICIPVTSQKIWLLDFDLVTRQANTRRHKSYRFALCLRIEEMFLNTNFSVNVPYIHLVSFTIVSRNIFVQKVKQKHGNVRN